MIVDFIDDHYITMSTCLFRLIGGFLLLDDIYHFQKNCWDLLESNMIKSVKIWYIYSSPGRNGHVSYFKIYVCNLVFFKELINFSFRWLVKILVNVRKYLDVFLWHVLESFFELTIILTFLPGLELTIILTFLLIAVWLFIASNALIHSDSFYLNSYVTRTKQNIFQLADSFIITYIKKRNTYLHVFCNFWNWLYDQVGETL
jgi:hypothetical protein